MKGPRISSRVHGATTIVLFLAAYASQLHGYLDDVRLFIFLGLGTELCAWIALAFPPGTNELQAVEHEWRS